MLLYCLDVGNSGVLDLTAGFVSQLLVSAQPAYSLTVIVR